VSSLQHKVTLTSPAQLGWKWTRSRRSESRGVTKEDRSMRPEARNLLAHFWVLPTLVSLYAAVGGGNTPGYAWWACATMIACALPIYCLKCDAQSLVTLLVLTHVIYYPLAVVLNLLPTAPGITEDIIWERTPTAMLLCMTAMAGITLGVIVVQVANRANVQKAQRPRLHVQLIISRARISVLLCLIIPYALFLYSQGVYFHSFADVSQEWAAQRSDAVAWLGYIEYVPYSALFLQIHIWRRTRDRRDAVLCLVGTLIPLVTLLPSGSRDFALRGVAPVLGVSILSYARLRIAPAVALLCGAIFLMWYVVIGMELYRNQIAYRQASAEGISGRAKLIAKSFLQATPGLERAQVNDQLQQLSRRMADYAVPAMATLHFPGVQPYRHMDETASWLVYILPRQLRPAAYQQDTRDSAQLAAMIGFRGGTLAASNVQSEGSSPGMIIGDWYSRFGWFGVFFGMAACAAALRVLDLWLLRGGLYRTVVLGLLLFPAMRLAHNTLFNWLMFFTRALAITLVLAFLITWFLAPRRLQVVK
jgi:hypothetical protein